MPKRSREDSPPQTSYSPSPTPDPSSPGSSDAPFHSSKFVQTSREAPVRAVMKCSLPPHEMLEFTTFEDYEIHYSKVHAYRCLECRKNLPTEHFLNLHISENHDPLSEARKAKGEKTNYDYFIVNSGIDKRSSMLRSKHRRRSSAASRAFHREQRSNEVEDSADNKLPSLQASESPKTAVAEAKGQTEGQDTPVDADIDELASTMSSLKFVPPSVRFGQGRGRGSLSRS